MLNNNVFFLEKSPPLELDSLYLLLKMDALLLSFSFTFVNRTRRLSGVLSVLIGSTYREKQTTCHDDPN